MNAPEYKRPESVLVVVYTAAGEVLMLQRRRPKGFWQSVTGSLQAGETPLHAARRELREETGLDLDVHDCLHRNRFEIMPAWRANYAPGVTTNLEHIFTALCPGPVEIRLDAREHSACRWVVREEAAELAGSVTNRHAILEFVAL